MTLQYKILENGWATNILTPIKELTDDDKSALISLLIRNTLIIWNNQSLTKQEELDFISSLGEYDYSNTKSQDFDEEIQSLFYPDYPGIMRVTGKPGVTGHSGQFGHSEELSWHSDQPTEPNRKPYVYLYAVEGSHGSVTHWTNGILAYNSMNEEDKAYYDSFRVQYYGQRYRKDLNTASFKHRKSKDEKLRKLNLYHKVVQENTYGQMGFTISPLQVGRIMGMGEDETLEFTSKILDYLTQPEYVYSHHWQDGDVVISDQLFGIHKRDYFDKMDERLIHRIAFNAIKDKHNGNL